MMTKTKLAELQKAAIAATDTARRIAEGAGPDHAAWDAKARDEYDSEMTKARGLLEQIKTGKRDLEIMDTAKGLAADIGSPTRTGDHRSGSAGHIALTGTSVKAMAHRIAERMTPADDMGRKALLPAGSTVTTVPMLAESPIALGRPALSLLDVLGAVQRAPKYTYLRQITRTNNAAPVAQGETKPTSVLGLEEIDAELHVVAHMSEPIPKYWLEDTTALEQFVADELLFGLRQALEAQVITGDGLGENLTGMANVSGIQTHAFATDLLTTMRGAITKLETVGHEAGVFVLAPADWEKLELARTDTAGQLELGGPVDRAARKLWSVPVVLSLGLPASTALLLDLTAVDLSTDSAGVETKWSENVSDDFSKNQLRARVEGRFEVDVRQPLGVVKIATAAA
ncbi:phage major capsid protein [Nocardia otitidiscaviarum]|uniref:Phage major capsid protein n=1 Tax=Nocardia otitidiscaviarum TaxID=1823 RepID=A0A516NU19_9NOCA|nr:phage major capsid protein [Nocardia otitidiscaviarum]MCP9621766.1 phage major capsid protein [Nocardia otitidiscaviarum]QDP82402.1 phage major capsid protein [Nocardia otitidiscaviarum]